MLPPADGGGGAPSSSFPPASPSSHALPGGPGHLPVVDLDRDSPDVLPQGFLDPGIDGCASLVGAAGCSGAAAPVCDSRRWALPTGVSVEMDQESWVLQHSGSRPADRSAFRAPDPAMSDRRPMHLGWALFGEVKVSSEVLRRQCWSVCRPLKPASAPAADCDVHRKVFVRVTLSRSGCCLRR